MIPVGEFLKRLPEGAKEERALIEAAFSISVNLREKLNEVRGNNRLSDIGKQEQIKQIATGAPLGHLKQIRNRVGGMTTDTKNLRLALKIQPPDRSDVYGELQRAELRQFLRTAVPPAERLRAVMEDEALTEAVVLGHRSLSGLSAEQFEHVSAGYLERKFGPQLRGIDAREEVLDTLNTAVEIATKEFLRESQLTEKEIQ
jgi:hypothetical protein